MCWTGRMISAAMALCLVGQVVQAQTQPAVSALWVMDEAGKHEDGLRPLSGSDGVTTRETREGSLGLATSLEGRPSSYIYFDVTNPDLAQGEPVFVTVEFSDEQFGATPTIEYDSIGPERADAYRRAEDQTVTQSIGSKRWQRVMFELREPRFDSRQNIRADFRYSGGRPIVREVTISTTRPAEWEELNRRNAKQMAPLVKVGAGGEVIVGGYDPSSAADAESSAKALDRALPGLKALGITSHEVYVRWNLCEPKRGQWDWSVYDRYVQVYRKHGVKWVPFLICGSPYSLPNWYYRKKESQGYVCLEHGEESDVQSLWNPAMREHAARFIQAFCEHYREAGVIESILLGVTGNYGEAIYVASGNDWTAHVHGPYHTHPGFWAGDGYAADSFRRFLRAKYGDDKGLRLAWGENVRPLEITRPFLQKDAPNERAWLDVVDWYQQSMSEYARFWMTETRRHFPGEIYLCTGGHAPPEHGADFGEQCKIASEVRGGVRITNEASDYMTNFSLTRWVASAGQQYGAYYSFEPAGEVTPHGVIKRIYNATSSGARGLHHYNRNLLQSQEATENWVRFGREFKQRKPVVEIGVFYPSTHIKLNGQNFIERTRPLRDRFDFGFVSEGQILDAGLARVKALIWLHGNVSEPRVFEMLSRWQNDGGLILYPDALGRLRTVEGDESISDVLFGPRQVQQGRVEIFNGDADGSTYRDFLTRTLAAAEVLSADTRAMIRADGVEDSVFVTLTDRELLWYNANEVDLKKDERTIPGQSIIAHPMR